MTGKHLEMISHIVLWYENSFPIDCQPIKRHTKFTDVWSSTNKIRCVVTLVSIRYPVTLLINLK